MRTIKQCIATVGVLLLSNHHLYADIVTDGTVGKVVELTGKTLNIEQGYGLTIENNLFHSFRTFNVNSDQAAVFKGEPSITNIFARVTGTEKSTIEGMIRSEILNADLYLLNPSGFLFGNNARLDMSGSFYASTADYIRFGQENYFYANPTNKLPLLVTAPPSAFGFLSNHPQSITIQNSSLKVSEGKGLTLIGGDNMDIWGSQSLPVLSAPSGRINLASVDSAGEVVLASDDLLVTSFEKLGGIQLSSSWPYASDTDGTSVWVGDIDVSGVREKNTNAGQVFIRAGEFLARGARISANNYGEKNGLVDISILGKISLSNRAKIRVNGLGDKSQGGGIRLKANALFVGLEQREFDHIIRDNPDLFQTDPLNSVKTINSNKVGILSDVKIINHKAGTVGEIQINTPELSISYGIIEASTTGSGKGGDIRIHAEKVLQKDFGFINAAVDVKEIGGKDNGTGQGGNITINASQEISLSNGSTIGTVGIWGSKGTPGKIELTTHHLLLQDKCLDECQSSEINGFNYGSGGAGSIRITADMISLSHQARIITEATSASGGDITLTVHDSLRLFDNSRIITNAFNDGTGGDLTITNPQFVILDKSHLTTSANRDHGGNIKVNAGYLIGNMLPNPGLEFYKGSIKEIIQKQDKFIQKYTDQGYSVIDSTSKEGIDGDLTFNAKSWEFPGLLPLPELKSLPLLNRNRCSFRKEDMSRFIITSRDILPRSPEDLRTHTIRLNREGN